MTTGDDIMDAVERGDMATAKGHALQLYADADAEKARIDSVTLMQSALYYASLGIPTFPLWPNGTTKTLPNGTVKEVSKTPMTSNGFKDATTDPEQISAWWTRQSDANIGLATGHKFDIVDVDGYDGLDFMYAGNPSRFDSLTILGIALTTSPGKRHLYIPSGLLPRNAAKKLHPEIDWRALGGYCVAPPSKVGNAQYKWLSPLELRA